MSNKKDDTFWLEGWDGRARSGVFTRSNLNLAVKEINNRGAKVVGIKLSMEDSFNLELMVEEPGEIVTAP